MKFVGSTIIYAYLQAIGVIYSHDKKCFLYKKIENTKKPIARWGFICLTENNILIEKSIYIMV